MKYPSGKTVTRVTRDVFYIFVNYGHGWEHELTEDTWREAREQLKCYRANCPQYPIKASRRRECIEPVSTVNTSEVRNA